MKIILFTFTLVIMLMLSCSKTSNTTTTSTTGTAFTHSVKTVFDKCASCHGSGKNNSSDWLYNAANYEETFKNQISKVYNTVKTIYSGMSQKAGLTQAEVDAIVAWYNAGYPASN